MLIIWIPQHWCQTCLVLSWKTCLIIHVQPKLWKALIGTASARKKWFTAHIAIHVHSASFSVFHWSSKPHSKQVETLKYLGILHSWDLSWSSHIDFICTKARNLIGLLYRRFYGNVDNHSLLELYSVLVRPHLEYAAPIWDPHFIKDTVVSR